MSHQLERIGQRLGNYQLIRLLGEGGFAEVYLGEHLHLKTQAAVKLLHTRLSADDIEGFRREAQVIAQLIHPHIVRVLDFGVEGNAPYLVMDFAPYGTLRNRHPKGTRVPLYYVTAYVRQVADALYYAHSQRLIHRDIKPENMLVGRNNEILLSDFGIALASQSSSYQNTQDVAGTIAYMAPEQIQAHPRPASDQYSLGIVVYEWLSGNRPFQGTYTEIAVKHTMVPPPPLREQLLDLPQSVEDVVMRALQKDPRQRFEDIHAFAVALEQASFNPNYRIAPGIASNWGPPQNSSGNQYSVQSPQENGQPFQPYSQYNTRVMTPSNPIPPMVSGPQPLQAYSGMMPLGQPQIRTPRRISRRAIIAGAAIAVAGGGATWFAATHGLIGTSNSSLDSGTPTTSFNTGGSNATTPGSTSPSTSPGSTSALVTYQGHSDYIWSVDWSPDGTNIVSCSSDGTAQVWKASTGQKVLSTRSHLDPARNDNWAKVVRWSPNSKQILTGFQYGTAEVLDTVSRQQIATFSYDTPWTINAVAWSPNGKYVATGNFDNLVMVYAVAGGNLLYTYTGHNDGINALAWSHDGTRIVSGSSDGTAQVWRFSDGHTLLKYDAHGSDVRSVSWSPDDSAIVSGGWDGTAKVWDSVTGNTRLNYKKHTGGMVNGVAWSHQGKYIASGGNDVNTHMWEAQTGNLVRTFYTYPIFGLAWSPDGSRIVTGGYNKIGQVWSAQ
jgi:eukaryotic-like serine/threonine-protein kinase